MKEVLNMAYIDFEKSKIANEILVRIVSFVASPEGKVCLGKEKGIRVCVSTKWFSVTELYHGSDGYNYGTSGSFSCMECDDEKGFKDLPNMDTAGDFCKFLQRNLRAILSLDEDAYIISSVTPKYRIVKSAGYKSVTRRNWLGMYVTDRVRVEEKKEVEYYEFTITSSTI